MYSFDVFDTLITRCTAEPKGIFLVMQEKIKRIEGFRPFLVDNFYDLRVGAEEFARLCASRDGRQEITLNDIYKALATTACITEEQQEKLKQLEVETECNNVLGIYENIQLLKNLKNKGERVVLISDMYLDRECIRSILCAADTVFQDISIYTSSEYGRTKSGGLFQIVQKLENIQFGDWVHYGDNIDADIKSAVKLGIKAIQYLPESVKEYENLGRDVYHQMSVGISKYIRNAGKKDVVGEIGCSLAGPILYPYISWVLKESVRKGIERLYFVARDGWILQQIADIIIQQKKYCIQTIYIYGSRKVWRLPAYDGSEEDFDRIFKCSDLDQNVSLEELAAFFQLKPGMLKPFMPEQFQKDEDELRSIRVQREYVGRMLCENKEFRQFLLESQSEKRNLIVRYLRQEIDTLDDRFAFVELAGTGLTQQLLARLIGRFYQGKIQNFYFKLDYIQESVQSEFLNFYPSALKRSYMLELLCRAPHGQTEGYKEEGGKVVPVLDLLEGEKIREYHLNEYRDAVLKYVHYMEEVFGKNKLDGNIRLDNVRAYMETITINPPERIAEYFCHMPFSGSGRSEGIVEFAPPPSRKQLRKIYFWDEGNNVRKVYQGELLDYALTVSDKAMRYKEKCQKYRKTKVGKWLIGWNRYFHTHMKPGVEYFCPWELLQGNIVVYGAGKVGRAYVKQARQRYARCSRLLWIDQNYEKLQAEGFQVNSPEDIREYSFDRVIIAIHNDQIRLEVWKSLREMGVEATKIYYG